MPTLRKYEIPQRTLTNDTLRLVFQQAVLDWELLPMTSTIRTWQSLFDLLTSLMTVSRNWKDIVLTSPRLWRNILFDVGDWGNIERCYFDMRICFQRSAAVPLQAWLYGTKSIEMFSSYVARQGVQNFSRICLLHMCDFDDPHILPQKFVPLFLAAPYTNIRHLSLRLGLTDVSGSDLMSIIQHVSPHLLTLFIDQILMDKSLVLPDRILLPKLQKFVIVDIDFEGAHFFLDLLECPNLVELAMVIAIMGPGFDEQNIPFFGDDEDDDNVIPPDEDDYTPFAEDNDYNSIPHLENQDEANTAIEENDTSNSDTDSIQPASFVTTWNPQFPHLTALCLGGYFNVQDVKTALSALPSVKDVVLFIYPSQTLTAVEHLAQLLLSNSIMSELQSLSIWNHRPDYQPLIQAIVTRPRRTGQPLPEVNLYSHQLEYPTEWHELQSRLYQT